MSALQIITGSAIPLKGNDIDTDRIIPARFLKSITFDGLGDHVFEDDRAQLNGTHPFDQAIYKDAKILVVNRNFGCGSSREHAPQAIARWGIEAIIGESFAEIFFGNCVAMGIPCVTADSKMVNQLQEAIATTPHIEVTLDLPTLTATYGTITTSVAMADGPHQMLVGGTWDACGQLVAQTTAIRATAAQLPYVGWSQIAAG